MPLAFLLAPFALLLAPLALLLAPLAFFLAPFLALWTSICHGLALLGGVFQAFWATCAYLSSFLRFLFMPWTLIYNICLVLWKGVSWAFWPFGRSGTSPQRRG